MEDSVLTFLEPDDMASFAIFDYDHTLVKPREGRRFPKDINDWEWLCPSVPATLKEIAGYCHLVIVTDQSKEWKVTQIENVIGGLHIPATVIIGVERQKPDTSLFLDVFPDFLEKEARTAFYVGDAAGRTRIVSLRSDLVLSLMCPRTSFHEGSNWNKYTAF